MEFGYKGKKEDRFSARDQQRIIATLLLFGMPQAGTRALSRDLAPKPLFQRIPIAYQYNKTHFYPFQPPVYNQVPSATEYVGQPEVVRRRRFKLTPTAPFGG